MLLLICTVLLLISGNFGLSFCPKGCKCKSYGYCYDCEMGYYMIQSGTCKRCPENCQSCSSVNKCEKCDVGYYKDLFTCVPCSTGCTQCLSSKTCSKCSTAYFKNVDGCTKCTSSCKTCTSEHNCITCNDGFKLNGTSCQQCPEGYFESSNSCVPCINNCASCLIMNECTKCKQGFFGRTCGQRCSSGCKDNVCEQNTGNCVCNENYVGNNCSLCKPHKYGQLCNLDCPIGCLTCNSDGACRVCQSGYFGIKCNCSNGCFGNKCNKFTGNCFQCKPFFQWPCMECVNGKWGNNCEKDCPDKCLSCISDTNCTKCKDGNYFSDGKCLDCSTNCQNTSCNAESGVCNLGCNQGYWGSFCDKLCPDNCLQNICNEENGKCMPECTDSYYGKACEKTVQCVNGTWGSHCEEQCSKNCSYCDIETGHCLQCKQNTFYGFFCNQECNETCIGRVCRFGKCEYGCKTGYYGERCQNVCSKSCFKQLCNRETGICDAVLSEDASSQGKVKCEDTIILLLFVAVVGVYAIVITVVLIRNRIKQRREADLNEGSADFVENEYGSTGCRNTIDSDHIYAIPAETTSESVPLCNLEIIYTLPSNNSTENMNMYINPVYADTKTSNEYEEVV